MAVTAFAAMGTALTFAKVVNDFVDIEVGPVTGFQFAQAGGKCLDNAMKILKDQETGGPIDPNTRKTHLNKQNALTEERIEVDNMTRSLGGSISNRNTSQSFYKKARLHEVAVKISSDNGIAKKLAVDIQKQLQESALSSAMEVQIEELDENEPQSQQGKSTEHVYFPNLCTPEPPPIIVSHTSPSSKQSIHPPKPVYFDDDIHWIPLHKTKIPKRQVERIR